ncbi:hypothetical protein PIB30_067187 [Stylosanthes scabra]|uniref:Uncharacterized protein n=1 Tax=Stylosanthes scabra TaxID=79078 RepID=A0ABU6ZLT6_9FABA|nr:hypothetical protein [Stylosanthes scabra]
MYSAKERGELAEVLPDLGELWDDADLATRTTELGRRHEGAPGYRDDVSREREPTSMEELEEGINQCSRTRWRSRFQRWQLEKRDDGRADGDGGDTRGRESERAESLELSMVGQRWRIGWCGVGRTAVGTRPSGDVGKCRGVWVSHMLKGVPQGKGTALAAFFCASAAGWCSEWARAMPLAWGVALGHFWCLMVRVRHWANPVPQCLRMRRWHWVGHLSSSFQTLNTQPRSLPCSSSPNIFVMDQPRPLVMRLHPNVVVHERQDGVIVLLISVNPRQPRQKLDAGFINPRSRQVYRIVSSNTTVKWVSIPRGLKD